MLQFLKTRPRKPKLRLYPQCRPLFHLKQSNEIVLNHTRQHFIPHLFCTDRFCITCWNIQSLKQILSKTLNCACIYDTVDFGNFGQAFRLTNVIQLTFTVTSYRHNIPASVYNGHIAHAFCKPKLLNLTYPLS
jgi:hypothetical protein